LHGGIENVCCYVKITFTSNRVTAETPREREFSILQNLNICRNILHIAGGEGDKYIKWNKAGGIKQIVTYN